MATQRRRFTEEEKIEMLRQASVLGVTNALRKYNLSYSVYSKWKEKFNKSDLEVPPKLSVAEMMLLLEENKRLKKIVADQALSIEKKTEELNKILEKQDRK